MRVTKRAERSPCPNSPAPAFRPLGLHAAPRHPLSHHSSAPFARRCLTALPSSSTRVVVDRGSRCVIVRCMAQPLSCCTLSPSPHMLASIRVTSPLGHLPVCGTSPFRAISTSRPWRGCRLGARARVVGLLCVCARPARAPCRCMCALPRPGRRRCRLPAGLLRLAVDRLPILRRLPTLFACPPPSPPLRVSYVALPPSWGYRSSPCFGLALRRSRPSVSRFVSAWLLADVGSSSALPFHTIGSSHHWLVVLRCPRSCPWSGCIRSLRTPVHTPL